MPTDFREILDFCKKNGDLILRTDPGGTPIRSRNRVEKATDLQFQYRNMLGQMPSSLGAGYEEWKKDMERFSEREEVKLDTEVNKLCQALIKKHEIV